MPITELTPSQPKNEPAARPISVPSPTSAIASISSIDRRLARCIPSARSSADSRCRSITDRLSVLATPTRAMTTATPSRAVITISITFRNWVKTEAMTAPPPLILASG